MDSPVMRPPLTVTPSQFSRKRCSLMPQARSGWLEPRLAWAASPAQAFWTATSTSQSSTRSLLGPKTLATVARFTKVPSVQPAAARDAGEPTLMLTAAWWVSPPEEVMRVVKVPVPVVAAAVAVNSQLVPDCATEESCAEVMLRALQVKP